MNTRRTLPLLLVATWLCTAAGAGAAPPRQVFVVPNFHPASCGWLANWSTERNYCANSYFDHLDRVREDPTYNFALSECNNLIAMLNFRPDRADELRRRIREGRVELCNAFFLEPTVNLSGGEALVKMGVEGLRWQQQVMGVRPRTCWMIDVTGMHAQMAQIVAGLGLDALVYCRLNPTGSTLHWLEAPDGTRTLAVSPGHYLEWRPMFGAKEPLAEKQLAALADDIRARLEPLAPEKDARRPDAGDLKSAPRRTPAHAPVLILGGSGDYNLAPLCQSYPRRFLEQFRAVAPEFDVRFSTLGKYLDAVLPGIRSGAIRLPALRGGTEFTYKGFWIQNPRVKAWYRRSEQQLQAAEMLATAASLRGKFEYPAQALCNAWLMMLLNMDRNTLWGAAGGMVFEDPRSWDVRDRFEAVDRISRSTLSSAKAARRVVFNPLNWRRTDSARLPEFAAGACQTLPGREDVLCRLDLPPTSVAGLAEGAKVPARPIPLPGPIETRHYRARVNASSGAIESLVLKPSGREVLGGPANVIVAERQPKKRRSTGDHMLDRPQRERVADSSQTPCRLKVTTGPVATVVEAESTFLDVGRLRRMTIFYHEDPRIEFETELNDLPDSSVVLAEFPLSGAVTQQRRGIPYGFACDEGELGIVPAVRWSHYQMSGTGVALLDQGLSGREIVGNTPVIYLYNAVAKYRGYPNAWLSGEGRHVLHYALVAHEGDFLEAKIARRAWEFNQAPIPVGGPLAAHADPIVETSDNVIVEALRREGQAIELRMVECLGRAGNAEVRLNLPHRDAAQTDMTGARREPLGAGPEYRFPVRPQQIVTLRFRTDTAVKPIEALTRWDELVPPSKLEALRRYLPDVKGHPPAGTQ